MPKEPKYTQRSIATVVEANKLKSRSELRSFNNSMYQAAYKLGLLSELFGPVNRSAATKAGKAKANAKTITATKVTPERKPKAKRNLRKVFKKAAFVTITDHGIDEEALAFNFDISFNSLNAIQAEKLLNLCKEFNR